MQLLALEPYSHLFGRAPLQTELLGDFESDEKGTILRRPRRCRLLTECLDRPSEEIDGFRLALRSVTKAATVPRSQHATLVFLKESREPLDLRHLNSLVSYIDGFLFRICRNWVKFVVETHVRGNFL